jgi:hypothetical protein
MKGLLLGLFLLAADGERDNNQDNVRPIPPPGVAVPDADKAELEAGLKALGDEIALLRPKLSPDLRADVEIYPKAVRYALQHNEFFNAKEIPVGKNLLKNGLDRAAQLKEGKSPWAHATGLVARGYVSRIDGSVQPYGLVVPASYAPGGDRKFRLDTWFHGRGETLSEVNFIDQRQKSAGEFTPKDTFVLHLYGRYCNANKLAGEIDLFEALENVKRQYPIDDDRIVIRGFSMGGAACWQFAVHYTDRWCAAAPGAGFSETPDFLKVFQNETLKPAPYEQTLWHLYDCTDYAANLFNLPTVAYSGEIDKQKQAADIMAKAMKEEGLDLVHLIGPKTAHKYEPEAKAELNRRIDEITAKGRNPFPSKIRFTTWTLRYNRMHWISVNGLKEHWKRARVEAEDVNGAVTVTTSNVTHLTLNFSKAKNLYEPTSVKIDGQDLSSKIPRNSAGPWHADFQREGETWKMGIPLMFLEGLVKKPGLQGPIDDAFMDSFVMVRPTGKARNEQVQAWVEKEMKHAVDHWRSQFRGDARVVDDTAVSPQDISGSNLVLWGDAQSNKVIAQIADKLPALPITAETQVPLMIYPNPLQPGRYVVLNSGFTFREYDYLNNARQVPKLPDWAVVDVTTPPNSRWPGKIVAADFFDETWKVKK